VRRTRVDGTSGGNTIVVDAPPAGLDDALAVVRRLLGEGRAVVLTLDPLVPPDLATVGALARLVLLARRTGACLEVQAPESLRQLVTFLGLGGALGVPSGSDVSGQVQR